MYAIFSGALQNFFTQRGLVAVSREHPKSNLAIAQEQSAKVRLCKTAPAKHGSTFLQLHYKQASNKQNMAPAPILRVSSVVVKGTTKSTTTI